MPGRVCRSSLPAPLTAFDPSGSKSLGELETAEWRIDVIPTH